MIRWSYLLPRLLMLALLGLALVLGLDPLLRWSIVQSGQSLTGAKVELADLQSSLVRGQIHLGHFRAANPKHPERNLFEADEAFLTVDTRALLLGRVVIKDGQIRGVRLDGQRATSGALDGPDRPTAAESGKSLVEWLSELGRLLHDPVVENFESVGVTKELIERWPKEYEAAEAEARQLRDRVQSLRANYEQARKKPLDNLDAVRRVVTDVAGIRNDLERLKLKAAQLAAQAKDDQQRVEYARRRDVGRIQEALRLARIDTEMVTEYLLGPEMAPYVTSLVDWAKWSKDWLDVAGDPPQPARARGTNFVFPRDPPAPDWLVERLAISGEAKLGSYPTPFEGVLTHLTSQQKITGQPAHLVIQLAGRHPARLDVVADARGERPKHSLVFDCPNIQLGQRSLGNDRSVTVTVDEGRAHLWMELTIVDQQLDGRIVWKQDDIRFGAVVGDRLGGPRAARLVATALRESTNLHTQLDIRGPFDRPKWKIHANLGPQLVEGLEAAARQELADRRDALLARLHVEVAQEVTRLNSKIYEEQQKILGQLQVGEQVLNELQQLAAATGVLDPLKRKLESTGIQQKIDALGIPQRVDATGIQQRIDASGIQRRIEAAGLPMGPLRRQ